MAIIYARVQTQIYKNRHTVEKLQGERIKNIGIRKFVEPLQGKPNCTLYVWASEEAASSKNCFTKMKF